jgi:hypothetical protein
MVTDPESSRLPAVQFTFPDIVTWWMEVVPEKALCAVATENGAEDAVCAEANEPQRMSVESKARPVLVVIIIVPSKLGRIISLR